MDTEPLKWPFSWEGLSAFDRFVLWDLPWIGPQSRVRRNIQFQLKNRSVNSLTMWSGYPAAQVELAQKISKIAKKNANWPNDRFIPNDPFEIVIWAKGDDLALAETLAEIEKMAGIQPKAVSEWQRLMGKRYDEVLYTILMEMKNNDLRANQ